MIDIALETKNLHTNFYSQGRVIKAVNGISFNLEKKKTLGIVGESGCGKSVTALSLLRLIPNPPGKIVEGTINFEGQNILEFSDDEIRKVRGNKISMIFQEPLTSLNPVLTIGFQIMEVLQLHKQLSKKEANDLAKEMLSFVKIPDINRKMKEYPHELSGGMLQRVMIAIALSCNPKVLIADEPTTALDVTIQAQILDLIQELQEKFSTAIMLISHDIGVISEMCDKILVMYAGRIVEEAKLNDLFELQYHPYTKSLFASIPILNDPGNIGGKKVRLKEIKGIVPSLHNLPEGCYFAPRCIYATKECYNKYPPIEEKFPGHFVACWNADAIIDNQQ